MGVLSPGQLLASGSSILDDLGDIYIYMKVTQSYLTPCDPMASIVHGILEARILEWVECIAFPFSRGSSQPRDQTQVSCIAGGFFTS